MALGPDLMEDMPQHMIEAAMRDLPTAAVAAYAAMPLTLGFESVADVPKVTAGLLKRGRTPNDLWQIVGGNWLRLYRHVW